MSVNHELIEQLREWGRELERLQSELDGEDGDQPRWVEAQWQLATAISERLASGVHGDLGPLAAVGRAAAAFLIWRVAPQAAPSLRNVAGARARRLSRGGRLHSGS